MKNVQFYIKKSIKNHFALGAFNFSNMETLKAIAYASKETNSPCFCSTSEGAIEYMGLDMIVAMFNAIKRETKAPIFLHLDHGKSYQMCKKCVDAGYDSVMIDGSSLPFKENVALTKKVCDYAHEHNTLVEGEIGVLKGVEDNTSSQVNIYTNPKQAHDFVDQTNCDLLAIAIGTSHGAYKYEGKQSLNFEILKEIEKLLPNFPLVLHGASSVPQQYIQTINAYGGNIIHAIGINEKMIKKCVKNHNIVKVNTDTDLRLAFTSTIRKYLYENPHDFNFRSYLQKAQNEVQKLVQEKMVNLFYSENQK